MQKMLKNWIFSKWKLYIVILFALFIGFLNSIYLSYYSFSIKSWVQNINKFSCSVETCGSVVLSPYSELFGIPVAVWAIFWFLFLFFLKLYGRYKQLYYLILIWGFFYALYLQYVLHFVLKAFCKLCFVNFSIILLILILEIVKYIKDNYTFVSMCDTKENSCDIDFTAKKIK